MSTTVTYKGNTLTTVNNQTKKLNTAGKYMEDDVTLQDVTAVPTGNIDIDDSGVFDVTQYATATVPELEYEAHHLISYRTQDNQRRCDIEAGSSVDEPGFWSGGDIVAMDTWLPAVAANTVITPTESSQTVGGADYMMEGAVTVSAIPSNYVGSGVTQRSSTDLTASGATVTAPAGYYASSATKTVASGTEGTPTATKGTVSNNSVSVTPSVTNAAGYVSGGTHTGTAVTVTASELVSGSQTITTNGTYDVTTLASIVAAIESGDGIVRENIVPEQTVTAAAEWTHLTSTSSILEGEYYAYTVDGVERLGTGVKANDNVYLADIDCLWDLSGAGFLSSIYYENVVYLTPVSAGTYTVKVDKITLANSGLKTQVIFPEQSVTATTTEQSGYSANISVSENITNGVNYIVTMDRTAYLCYGKQLYGNNDVYCGDDTVIWGNPANARYPFMVATWGNGTTAWGVANNTAHTVKIEKVLSFDSAELGTKTITVNGTYTASTDDLDGYSSITVNVESGSTRKIIIPEQEVNIQTTYTQITNYSELFTEGEEYIITLNGTEYTRTATEYYGSVALLISNNSQFYLETTSMGNIFIDVNDTSMYGTYTLKVEQESGGGGSANLQTKSVTYTPTTSQQTATVTADSGYDGLSEVNITVNAMSTGTAGTPSATKGSVSNHSITVTPSVTNTTGYITGGTKTGTGVTVSASELVSGNLAITDNGTNINVTNYATVSVAVPLVTYYTGSSAPSSSLGSNGDIYLQS